MTESKKTFLLFVLFFSTSVISLRSLKKLEMNHLIIEENLISKEAILSNSSLQLPQRLILIQTNSLEQELKENLSLKYISVNKQLIPFGLKIYIQKRIPVAYGEMTIDGRTIKGFVDANGIFVPKEFISFNRDFDFSLTILGWRESYSDELAKILKINDKFDIEINEINISQSGFISLQEQHLSNVLLGFESKHLDTQLKLLVDMKEQINKLEIITEIKGLDLTDPLNPKIKVFKP